MKTPTNYGGFDLAAYVAANNQFVMADLFTISLIGGTVLRYTSAESDITVAGNVFDSKSILISRKGTRNVIGVEVDSMDVEIFAQPTNLIGSVPFLQALRAGALDGATVLLERYVAPSFGSAQYGTVVIFSGLVGEKDIGRFGATLSVNSELELLNIQMPRNLYQPGCLNTLFDTLCTLNKAAYGVTNAATSGSTASVVNSTLSQADGYFDLGTILWTSGANSGVTRTVKRFVHSGGVITMMTPLLNVPLAGDAFTIFPGCDKTKATCNSKFSNVVNFRGYPFIPAPDSIT